MMSSAITFLLAAAAPPAGTHPLFLAASESGGMIRIEVRGLSARRFAGHFTVEAQSGGNRSVQNGNANLEPGAPVTLVSLSLTQAKGWTAVLRVRPDGGAPYEITAGQAR
jgi:hypothetical protein